MPHCSWPGSNLPPDSVKLITVDPGISGTGVAFWAGNRFIQVDKITSASDTWEEQVNDIARDFHDMLDRYKPDIVAYELPAFMIQAMKQNKRGDIIKLTIMAGALHGIALSFTQDIRPVPIINWKGQVDKLLMNERVVIRMAQLQYPLPKLSTHELDAIGIGLYMLGFMK